MIKGDRNYPRTVTSAYAMLTCFQLASPRRHHTERTGDKGNRGDRGSHGGRDDTVIQHTAPSGAVFIPCIDGRTSYPIKYFNCEKWGHYDNQCPEPTQYEAPNNSGQNLAQLGMCLAQGSIGGAVCSTMNCAKNNSIDSKSTVIPLEEHLRIYSNGGHMDYTIRGTLEILLMDIYVNDNSMVNILSLKEVADSFHVTMDTKEEHDMLVHHSEDKDFRLKECGKDLYYLDVSNPEIITLATERGDTDYSFFSTVNTNMEYFTRAEV